MVPGAVVELPRPASVIRDTRAWRRYQPLVVGLRRPTTACQALRASAVPDSSATALASSGSCTPAPPRLRRSAL
ncbi:hypothetical protein [Protofrankia symbiont of Coriaria ruscifolia]|uniref:hypothetical protein n=1 Tax=Protofrankia symbiont of Coriaria ruscifolia TaxID=1306542 RepID=UPI001A94A215|nr:hypothetical protein [Protofrankia symbiont of Coriaria ruscifolia]